MKERPIIFKPEMVRAILAGRKTQTRRVVKPMAGYQSTWLTVALINLSPKLTIARTNPKGLFGAAMEHPQGGPLGWVRSSYGEPGDRLWVRETWWQSPHITYKMLLEGADTWPDVGYVADGDGQFEALGWKKRSSIHMSRRFSRLTLEIESVRVERVQDISEEDARAEGIQRLSSTGGFVLDEPGFCHADASGVFSMLWDSIHGPGAWERNEWVWVLTFRRL